MNKLRLFPIALTALVLGACSSEDVMDNGGQGPVAPGEKGYVSFAINLPTTPSTRANDQFADGDATEYNVKDATLLIFSGNDESSATFSGAYNLKATFMDQPIDGQISTTTKVVQEIEKPSGNYVYALVVLNKTGFLSYDEGENKWYYGTDTNNEKTELSSGTTFSTFAYTAKTLDVATVANSTDGNFLMFNAPLYDKQGGSYNPNSGSVKTLAIIDKNKIYPTETQAQNNPAASIYVERAVAKVTVNQGSSFNGGTHAAALMGWILDITNKKSFPVRNMGTAGWWGYNNNDYRFVGETPVDNSAATKYYRTYFGIDPNYDGSDNGKPYTSGSNVISDYDGFKTNYGTAPTTTLNSMGSNAYCLENTFNVDNMRKDQTTRVIVAAKLTIPGAGANDGSFFVLNNDKTTFYSKDDVVKLVKDAYIKSDFVQEIIHDPINGLNSSSTFDEGDIEVTFKKENSEPAEDIGSLEGGTVLVADVHTATSAKDDFKQGLPEGLKSNNKEVTDAINDMYAISFYKRGIAYYPVMIKHFGDDQTPWNGIDDGYSESYPNDPDRDNDWLGRYGVLRNNWYEITVNSVNNIGSAEVTPETGYDDPVNSWISVKINVLSWARRSQNVEL